jgi:hypothetical protein
MSRRQKPKDETAEDEILRQLRARDDGGSRSTARPLDGALLAMVIELVSRSGGQIAFSRTKDGTKAVITVWYKGYPTKGYFDTPEEVEQNLAATIHIFAPKGEAWDEWRSYADGFR